MSEISEILADVRENLTFLRELGVEGMAAELPDLDLSKFAAPVSAASPNRPPSMLANAPARPASAAPERPAEKFVPADDFVRKAPSTSAPTPRPAAQRPPSRMELLKKTQLRQVQQKAADSVEEKKETAAPRHEAPTPADEPIYLKSILPMARDTAPVNLPPMALDAPAERINMQEPLENTMFGDLKQRLPESGETIEQIRDDIGNCTRCPLHEGRTKIVHSTGNRKSELMFIGEAPGADEDAKGEPFVGRAGQLLTKIIEAIGISREDVFIGNINRCRPPGNRQPTLPEAHTCRPFLLREIAVVRPKVIVVLGNTACQNLLDTKVGITKLRGHFHDYFGVKVMPTFHPAYLLRDPSKKREVWEDMKKVRALLAGEPE